MELLKKIGKLLRPELSAAPVFQAHCRKSPLAKTARSKKTVLMSQYNHTTTIYANSLVARAYQEKGITPRSFFFGGQVSSPLNSLYDSFGARLALGDNSSRKYQRSARNWAHTVAGGLRTKRDLLDVKIEGLEIGHLVYDSYLRYRNLTTIELQGEWLTACLQSAAEIFWDCMEYFDKHEVAAVIPDHFVYNRGGIISRLAWQRDIPLLFYRFSSPFYIYRLPRRESSPLHLEVPYQHPFDRYPELFAALPEDRRRFARSRAKAAFENHLLGKRKDMIFGGHSAYGQISSKSLFKNDAKPRILILLHDFCDAPHVFGNWIFPDFYEWIHHLLRRARDTGFQWVVKPHPNLQAHGLNAMGQANLEVVENLKKEYPEVLFLDPGTSNLQIINEGISAMFTGYGSAGHEFAYFGVPVVNASPNPHMRYDFNIHAKTVEEYDDYILRADRLGLRPNKESIEEFYYMYNFFLTDSIGAPFEILPQDDQNSSHPIAIPKQFDALDHYVRSETADFRSQFSEYLDRSLAGIPVNSSSTAALAA